MIFSIKLKDELMKLVAGVPSKIVFDKKGNVIIETPLEVDGKSISNLRLSSITENFIDWCLHPKWYFSYRSLIPGSKFFKNYGYPVPGAMKGKLGIIAISYGGPMVSYWNFSFFDNIPYRRIKKSVFQLGGLKTKYLRFYSVLPQLDKRIFEKYMNRVKKLARNL